MRQNATFPFHHLGISVEIRLENGICQTELHWFRAHRQSHCVHALRGYFVFVVTAGFGVKHHIQHLAGWTPIGARLCRVFKVIDCYYLVNVADFGYYTRDNIRLDSNIRNG